MRPMGLKSSSSPFHNRPLKCVRRKAEGDARICLSDSLSKHSDKQYPVLQELAWLIILKEINAEYSLEGLMLKLKLQYFGHMMGRADSLEETLMLGKVEGRRRTGVTEDEMVGWHHRLNGHEFEHALRDSEGQGSLVCCSPWGRKEKWLTKQQHTVIFESSIGRAFTLIIVTTFSELITCAGTTLRDIHPFPPLILKWTVRRILFSSLLLSSQEYTLGIFPCQ